MCTQEPTNHQTARPQSSVCGSPMDYEVFLEMGGGLVGKTCSSLKVCQQKLPWIPIEALHQDLFGLVQALTKAWAFLGRPRMWSSQVRGTQNPASNRPNAFPQAGTMWPREGLTARARCPARGIQQDKQEGGVCVCLKIGNPSQKKQHTHTHT